MPCVQALDAEAAAQVLAVDTAPGILSASLTEHATDAERAANRRALGCALLERVRAPLGALFAPEAAEALARKVTGMLLWRDTDDVLGMLSRPDDLFAHCRDAMLVRAYPVPLQRIPLLVSGAVWHQRVHTSVALRPSVCVRRLSRAVRAGAAKE